MNNILVNIVFVSFYSFVSTLLSAVLTQHLAWVATVTPAGGTPSKTYLDKHSAKWVCYFNNFSLSGMMFAEIYIYYLEKYETFFRFLRDPLSIKSLVTVLKE